MRILGIDYGKKRIGAAVSDPLGLTAQPVEVIENNASAMNRIKELCEKYEAGSVVGRCPCFYRKTPKGPRWHTRYPA